MPNTSKNPQKNTPAPAIRAYLGGSFDPVHDGHLQMAMTVYQRLLPIAKQQQRTLHVSLLPNARSPFKEKSTDPKHRLAMLKLATLNTPLQINELELWQTPPVYTIDSVRTLRQRYPYDSLIFIIGMDSALSLSKWKNGLELTDYVNLWVFNRDDLSDINNKNNRLLATTTHSTKKTLVAQDTMNLHIQLPAQLQSLRIDAPIDLLQPTSQASTNSRLLKNTHQGHIYIDSHPIATISSTQIRQQLQPTENRSNIMSAAARQMTSIAPINDIIDNTAPNPLAKWLNPAVYQY
ncbi:MAG: nicotinate-nicotinamide nucleotide adenylyltransferase, partial [Psychrobacter sp.]